MKNRITIAFAVVVAITLHASAEPPVEIFILAGQSNMQGQGVVDLDDPKNYNGGKGTLNHVMRQSPERYQHLKDNEGNWVVRDDVFIRYQTEHELKRGGLSIGFTGYGGNHHIGPELQFGHVVGDAIESPVLLIKTAWGGKSLYKDFRPPSAGGDVGEYYLRMLAEVEAALTQIDKDFPALAHRDHVISGFVWQQGWNDMVNQQAIAEYETNLVHLIHDLRKDLKQPNLPVVIGELGNGGDAASDSMKQFRAAQAAVATRPEFRQSVGFVKTTSFARAAEESPNVGHGHHWFGNAESYFLIGDALAKKMLELRKQSSH